MKLSQYSALLAATCFTTSAASGALLLTVDEFSSSAVQITISGTMEADTSVAPINPGIFFVAPDPDLTIQWYTGDLTKTTDTLLIGGNNYFGPDAKNNGTNTGYSIAFLGGDSIDTVVTAGTSITGTVRFTGVIDNVNFSASDLELFVGQVGARQASPIKSPIVASVPEPSTTLLSGVGALALTLRRRRS